MRAVPEASQSAPSIHWYLLPQRKGIKTKHLRSQSWDDFADFQPIWLSLSVIPQLKKPAQYGLGTQFKRIGDFQIRQN